MLIPFEEMKQTIKKAFLKAGMPEDKAELCASIHTQNSADGITSHGLNRVPRFIDYLGKGWVDPNAVPTLEKSMGNIEVYNGNLGPGVSNSMFCANRAMELAKEHGMGLIAINNTTHWMRGGYYPLFAAENGFAALSWTNTESSMPVWGSKKPRIGNNPFAIAIPREKGPFLLDMAMSLYAYGKLEATRLKGEKLPYPGGFDSNGNLTDVPGDIEESMRILPVGYWKGSSFAILLDTLAVFLSGGKAAYEMDAEGKGSCTSCCQIFMVFNPEHFAGKNFCEEMADKMAAHINESPLDEHTKSVYYPGEIEMMTRKNSMEKGIFADDTVWAKVVELSK